MSAAGPELLLADPVVAPCTGRHFSRGARQRLAFPERDRGRDFAETREVPVVPAARQRPYQWDLASKLEPRQWHVIIVYALKAHGASENTGRRKWEKGEREGVGGGRSAGGRRVEVGEGRGAPPPRVLARPCTIQRRVSPPARNALEARRRLGGRLRRTNHRLEVHSNSTRAWYPKARLSSWESEEFRELEGSPSST